MKIQGHAQLDCEIFKNIVTLHFVAPQRLRCSLLLYVLWRVPRRIRNRRCFVWDKKKSDVFYVLYSISSSFQWAKQIRARAPLAVQSTCRPSRRGFSPATRLRTTVTGPSAARGLSPSNPVSVSVCPSSISRLVPAIAPNRERSAEVAPEAREPSHPAAAAAAVVEARQES